MEQQQRQSNNTPTPSRTIRVNQQGDYNTSVPHVLSQAENGRQFLVFTTIDEAVRAFTELCDNNIRVSYLTYSLFVKSQNVLTEKILRSRVLEYVPNANILYLRVDSNTHTGKVVVDLLSDYHTVKSSTSEDLRFFHFDPKRVKSRRSENRQTDQTPRQTNQTPRQTDQTPRQTSQTPRQTSQTPRQTSQTPRQTNNSSSEWQQVKTRRTGPRGANTQHV
jgi:hypothetical protein